VHCVDLAQDKVQCSCDSNEPLGSKKCEEISRLSERLTSSESSAP
jgi:hypothetical protein